MYTELNHMYGFRNVFGGPGAAPGSPAPPAAPYAPAQYFGANGTDKPPCAMAFSSKYFLAFSPLFMGSKRGRH